MIYWDEETKRLAKEKAFVVMVDRYDADSVPVFAVRRVVTSVAVRSNKNTYCGVSFEQPLSDGATVVSYSYLLSWTTAGDADFERLLNYHPGWMLPCDKEKEMQRRKDGAIEYINENFRF